MLVQSVVVVVVELLLHPLPTCPDAGPDLCTLHPDLCTLRLWCYPSINQRKYSTCTHGGGHWLQLALAAFFPSTHWRTYSTCTRATCTVWWQSVVVVVVCGCDVEVVVVAMGWWWFNGTGWLGETTLPSILYRPCN